MNGPVSYLLNKASEAEIAAHLWECDACFVAPLSTRVDIGDYSRKIASKSMRFEAWSDGTLVGLVAAYCNDHEGGTGHITSVSVLKAWTRKGIAGRLVSQFVEHAKLSGMRNISLEVASADAPAIRLYEKLGFAVNLTIRGFTRMSLILPPHAMDSTLRGNLTQREDNV